MAIGPSLWAKPTRLTTNFHLAGSLLRLIQVSVPERAQFRSAPSFWQSFLVFRFCHRVTGYSVPIPGLGFVGKGGRNRGRTSSFDSLHPSSSGLPRTVSGFHTRYVLKSCHQETSLVSIRTPWFSRSWFLFPRVGCYEASVERFFWTPYMVWVSIGLADSYIAIGLVPIFCFPECTGA